LIEQTTAVILVLLHVGCIENGTSFTRPGQF